MGIIHGVPRRPFRLPAARLAIPTRAALECRAAGPRSAPSRQTPPGVINGAAPGDEERVAAGIVLADFGRGLDGGEVRVGAVEIAVCVAAQGGGQS